MSEFSTGDEQKLHRQEYNQMWEQKVALRSGLNNEHGSINGDH